MAIYKQKQDKLIPLKEKKINLEKTVQGVVEKNISDVFGFEFVSSEFPLNNLRIDTLAFDQDLKCFVIIEYKKDRSFSVIDQGYAYLALLLNNKADFILEYNEKSKKNLKRDDIDWSQSRVIFIANSFTKYQQEAVGFQDLPIELWTINQYEEDLLLLNEIKASERSESIKTVAKGRNVDIVSKEIKYYSIEDHLKHGSIDTRNWYEELSQKILDLEPKFEIKPVQSYLGFRIGTKNVVNVKIRNSKITIELLRTQPKDLVDPEKKAYYFKNSFEYYNQHVTIFNIETEEDIEYALSLIKQVYKKFLE